MPEYLTRAEAAAALRLNPETLSRWARTGKGPPVTKLGTGSKPKLRYRKEALMSWLHSIEQVAA